MDRPTSEEVEAGIIAVLLARAVKQRIPNALAIKRHLDNGERISDHDLNYMLDILSHSYDNQAIVDRHPELQEVTMKLVTIYVEICRKALENEQA